MSIDDIYQELRQSTVLVSARGPNGNSSGSGFIYTSEGLAVTNAHVVRYATNLRIYLDGAKESLGAEIVGLSYCDDLAVLDIEGEGFQPVTFGDSDALKRGEDVVAIGYPLSSDLGVDLTVTSGQVNRINAQIENLENTIQIDASINPGNSGGPLTNMFGEIVGINTTRINATSQGQRVNGVNFAIASNFAKSILPQLESGKNLYDIGARIKFDDSTQLAFVETLEKTGQAEKIGVQEGDVLVSIDNHRFETEYVACRLMKETSYEEKGVEFAVMRGQHKLVGMMGKESSGLTVYPSKQSIDRFSQLSEVELTSLLSSNTFVTDITYDDEEWVIVFSDDVGFTDQRVKIVGTYSELEDLKDEYKESGYFITDLAFGDGDWIGVFSKGTSYTEQQIIPFKWFFPTDEVDALIAEGFAITSAARGNDRRLLVLSLGSGYNGHEYELVDDDKELSTKIDELHSENKTISLLVPSDGWLGNTWLLAYTNFDAYGKQKKMVVLDLSEDTIDTVAGSNAPTIDALQFLNGKWIILHR